MTTTVGFHKTVREHSEKKHGNRYPRVRNYVAGADETRTGAMIALVPSDADIDRLALNYGEPRDEVHLTLAYLGDARNWDDEGSRLIVALTELSAGEFAGPIVGNAFGLAHWNVDGDAPCWVLNIGGEQVDRVHHRVWELLLELDVGDRVPGNHLPWSAHVTLAYTDHVGLHAQMRTRLGEINFDKLRVAFGHNVTDVALLGSTATLAASGGDVTVPWHIVKDHSDCPTGKPWAVVKDSDGSVCDGCCHTTEDDADDHLAALYANENASGDVTDAVADAESLQTEGETMTSDADATDATNDVPVHDMQTTPWEGTLVIEGEETGDQREFTQMSITWATPPLPLRWNKEDSHGGTPHTVAVNVGRIDEVWRDGDKIMGRGVFDLGGENGREAYRLVDGKFLKGISIDADDITDADIEVVYPERGPSAGDDEDDLADIMMLFAQPEKVIYHAGRIRAATLCDIPAFVNAYIVLIDDDEDSVQTRATTGTQVAVESLVAHAGIDWTPPREWFTDPMFNVHVPLTISDGGRVYGHAARWNECHIGYPGACVVPPIEDDFVYFLTGETICDDGSHVPVGQITMNTEHASDGYGASRTRSHYDNTGCCIADVTCGSDTHGIWVAGAIRPDADQSRVRELRASGQLSGDWRRIGGQLRLVALLAVNVPGFPVPRTKARITNGVQLSLTAAGTLSAGRVPIDARVDDGSTATGLPVSTLVTGNGNGHPLDARERARELATRIGRNYG